MEASHRDSPGSENVQRGHGNFLGTKGTVMLIICISSSRILLSITFCYLNLLLHFFAYMTVFPSQIYAHCGYVPCPQRPEEHIRVSGTAVTYGCEPSCVEAGN